MQKWIKIPYNGLEKKKRELYRFDQQKSLKMGKSLKILMLD